MRRIWSFILTKGIAVFIVFAIITGFWVVSGHLKISPSDAKKTDALIEVAYLLLDNAVEPALFVNSDENGIPNQKMEFQRVIAFLNIAGTESSFLFSHFGSNTKNKSIDHFIPPQIKLLI